MTIEDVAEVMAAIQTDTRPVGGEYSLSQHMAEFLAANDGWGIVEAVS